MFVTPGSRVRRPNTAEYLFTPTIAFGGGSVGVVYATQQGEYSKIGNAVLFQLYLVISNKGSSTGPITVTNIPFDFRGTVQFFTAGNSTGMSFSGSLVAFSNTTSRSFQIAQNSSGAFTALTQTAMTPLSDLGISGICFAR